MTRYYIKSLYIICLLTFAWQCTNKNNTSYVVFEGKTMGTSYHINVENNGLSQLKNDIDSILIDINNEVSTYIPSSTISIINQDSLAKNFYSEDDLLEYKFGLKRHFLANYQLSDSAYSATGGFFDPTVMPLVNYWGFGYKEKIAVNETDTLKVLQLLQTVGLNKWRLEKYDDTIKITKPRHSELDFSAIAKGYAVDYIAEFLKSKQIKNFMVEIGGEIYCHGLNSKREIWNIGLSKPEIAAKINEFEGIITLSNQAMASSGNYRNYYDVNGWVYGHEINPITGMPEINSLLGATIVTNNCALADAYATAAMVMGLERSMEWLQLNKNVEAVLYFRDDKGGISEYTTQKLQAHLKDLQ